MREWARRSLPTPFDISMFSTGDGHINSGGVIFSRASTG
jgi:hypothetical protein